jgi:hypothetical protein
MDAVGTGSPTKEEIGNALSDFPDIREDLNDVHGCMARGLTMVRTIGRE